MKTGIYVLYWREGGSSLAAVGMLHDGTPWYAPINWTSKAPDGIASTNWDLVAAHLRLELQRP